jgi:putative hemolysin
MALLDIILVLVMPFLLLGSATCSAAETALFSLTHADRLRLRKTHPGAHSRIAALLSSPTGLLISILLGNTTVNSAFFVVSAVLGPRLFDGVWAVAFGIASLLTIILCGEVLPKSLAAANRVIFARALSGPLLAWHRLIRPVRTFAERFVIAPLARLFSPAGSRSVQPLSTEELSSLLDSGGRRGVLDQTEIRLLSDVVQLGTLRVKDVMTPRIDVEWLDASATTQELLKIVRETGHTRFPVCRGRLDEDTLAGVINAQRALPLLNKHGSAARLPLGPLVEPARYVPERARLDQLLEHFRATRTDAALCVSESGDLTGLVQIDDVIRELLVVGGGEQEAALDQVRIVGLGEWELPGRLSVRDWTEFFSPDDLPSQRHVSTVAGLILARLGRVPAVGDSVTIGTLRLSVREMSGRVIERVGVTIEPAPAVTPGVEP